MNAIELWKRWFDTDGNPWYQDDYGRDWCFFCGEQQPTHLDDCVFIDASKLIEENKNEQNQSQDTKNH